MTRTLQLNFGTLRVKCKLRSRTLPKVAETTRDKRVSVSDLRTFATTFKKRKNRPRQCGLSSVSRRGHGVTIRQLHRGLRCTGTLGIPIMIIRTKQVVTTTHR